MKYYIYVLKGRKDGNFYIGFTKNLRNRLIKHSEGKVQSTKYRKPLELVYYEVSFNRDDALHREKYLKTTYGKRYIRNRIKKSNFGNGNLNYYTGQEGYSRGTGKDRARFYEYALGSARESRDWYYKSRHILGESVTNYRIGILTQIIRLLLTMVPQQRKYAVKEQESEYKRHENKWLANVPMPE